MANGQTQYVALPDGKYVAIPPTATPDQLSQFKQKLAQQYNRPAPPVEGAFKDIPATGALEQNNLGTRIKHNLKLLATGAKEALPASSRQDLRWRLTPETGGASDLLLPILSAMMGGAAGTSAKQMAGKALGSKDVPTSTKEALKQDVEGGVEQGEYEMGGRLLGKIPEKWAARYTSQDDREVGNRLLSKIPEKQASPYGSMAARARLANLTSMTGEGEAGVGAKYSKVLPELDQTIAANGRTPQTPRQVLQVFKQTNERLDQPYFNQWLARIGNKKVMPKEIADALMMESNAPNLGMTPQGIAERRALRRAAIDYQRPWSYNALNAQRRFANDRLYSYYNKESQAQSTALSAVDTKIMKIVRDHAANIVYDGVDAIPGVPFDARLLKQQQGAIWSLADRLDSQIDKLTDAQLMYEGRTLRQKFQPSAYISNEGRMHGYLRGVGDLFPGGGPENAAKIQARKAFAPPSEGVGSWIKDVATMAPERRGTAWGGAKTSLQRLILTRPLPNLLRALHVYNQLTDLEDNNGSQ